MCRPYQPEPVSDCVSCLPVELLPPWIMFPGAFPPAHPFPSPCLPHCWTLPPNPGYFYHQAQAELVSDSAASKTTLSPRLFIHRPFPQPMPSQILGSLTDLSPTPTLTPRNFPHSDANHTNQNRHTSRQLEQIPAAQVPATPIRRTGNSWCTKAQATYQKAKS